MFFLLIIYVCFIFILLLCFMFDFAAFGSPLWIPTWPFYLHPPPPHGLLLTSINQAQSVVDFMLHGLTVSPFHVFLRPESAEHHQSIKEIQTPTASQTHITTTGSNPITIPIAAASPPWHHSIH
jgi:hypothetical protein